MATSASHLPGGIESTDKAEHPKPGLRFSYASVKTLKSWFLRHTEHPYPSIGDLELLQRQTSLSKQQIMNWFANTRRRRKFQHQNRAPAPPDTSTPAVPRRRASPAPFHQLSPLQRWRNSPPESEPVSASAIARAISNLGSRREHFDGVSPSASSSDIDEVFGQALSESSVETSQSSGSSLSSLHSYQSYGSHESLKQAKGTWKRRRRRTHAQRLGASRNALHQTTQPFQCTFCTETFRTKYNWQRHEKSFHLSLEKWQCTPNGPTFVDSNFGPACVYCGLVNPDTSHLAGHQHTACQDRLIEERTFFRKDHLRQHLKLVHNTQFRAEPMERWKCEGQEVRSRCGFCGLIMSDWTERCDHIADHFKTGETLSSWQGDWGFEPHVLEMVENAIPPYLIDYERNSPWPFTTQQGAHDSPTCAFELIQLEIEYYVADRTNNSRESWIPSDRELHYEACCIVLGSETLGRDSGLEASSWLRDIIMSSETIVQEARIRPMKTANKTRLTHLKIGGKANIFEGCNMEEQLRKFVEAPKLLDLEVKDDELQREACDIVQRAELCWPSRSGIFGKFLTQLIRSSAGWITAFRQRAGLPLGPARLTAREQPAFLPPSENSDNALTYIEFSLPPSVEQIRVDLPAALSTSLIPAFPSHPPSGTVGQDFSNDINCYRRLTRELSRFVAATMSLRNPNCHVPTDEELRYQARWLMFDDDDPWNQTPADNANWLRKFKSNIGLCFTNSNGELTGARYLRKE
ncbi:hypothetical protein GGR58DRAFT_515665 [Xylaria digitata]|nr:hypothetical protein GGR58DRAFT_515665 [Xylaria digitata]